MSIGKFNFAELKKADGLAAWIFFGFSIVVNMILINMMMAIINLSFEYIKQRASTFHNKFELKKYVKRTCKEVVGIVHARHTKILYEDEVEKEEKQDSEEDATEQVSKDFQQKTDQLMSYIEKTYLDGFLPDKAGKVFVDKMRHTELDENEKEVMNIGFDALFTPNESVDKGSDVEMGSPNNKDKKDIFQF